MPPLLRNPAALLIAVAYSVVAVAPCNPVRDEADTQPPFAASAERLAAWHTAEAAEPDATIAAECPCGCEKKSSLGGGSSGFALKRAEPGATPRTFALAQAHFAPDAPPAPGFEIDPVPI